MDQLMNVLQAVSVLNRDNGREFTNTARLDVIASLLQNSDFKRVETEN